MPQASDELREIMRKYFDDPISDEGPWRFLMARGYKDKAGLILPPVPSHTVSKYEWNCILFLCDEWDYGWEGNGL